MPSSLSGMSSCTLMPSLLPCTWIAVWMAGMNATNDTGWSLNPLPLLRHYNPHSVISNSGDGRG